MIFPGFGWVLAAWLLSGVLAAEDLNPIDSVVQEFRSQHVELSTPAHCSDAQFLRRASLDLTGYPPLPEEIAAFELDTDAHKRQRLVGQLLDSERYSWKWGRWLALQTGVDEQELTYAAGEMQCRPQDLFLSWIQWMQVRVQRDEPFDQLVENCLVATSREGRSGRQLYAELHEIAVAEDLTSRAYTQRQTNDLFWRRYSAIYDPQFRAEDVALRFMGVNLQCARCHDHPSQPLTMKDHQQFTAIFQPVTYREVPFTHDQKQSFLTGFLVAPILAGVAIFWGLSRSRQVRNFRKPLICFSVALFGSCLTAGVSYLHLVPGFSLDHRLSPGQYLLSVSEQLPIPFWISVLILTTLASLLAWGVGALIMRAVGRSFWAAYVCFLTPVLLLLVVDWAFVRNQSGELAGRNGSLHALHQSIFRWVGVGGCEQQPREILVSESPVPSAVAPKLLRGPELAVVAPAADSRHQLVEWLRDPAVPFLAEHYVNMIWTEYFGESLQAAITGEDSEASKGHRESVGQPLRIRLMQTLTGEFRSHNWSMRHLHELVATSELYRLSSDQQNQKNSADMAVSMPEWAHRFPPRRLSAEQYLACVETATGTKLEFGGAYAHREASPYQVASRYPWSDTFGAAAMRVLSTTTIDRAFSSEAAMFGLVEPGLKSQILRKDGWLARSLHEKNDLRLLIEQAYLRCFGRPPEFSEIASLEAMRPENSSVEQFAADIVWAMLNAAEFQYLL